MPALPKAKCPRRGKIVAAQPPQWIPTSERKPANQDDSESDGWIQYDGTGDLPDGKEYQTRAGQITTDVSGYTVQWFGSSPWEYDIVAWRDKPAEDALLITPEEVDRQINTFQLNTEDGYTQACRKIAAYVSEKFSEGRAK